jgi:hypothetical protein
MRLASLQIFLDETAKLHFVSVTKVIVDKTDEPTSDDVLRNLAGVIAAVREHTRHSN